MSRHRVTHKSDWLCDPMVVRVRDDDGAELNGEYAVETDNRYLNLMLESAEGRTDRQRSRNDQYVPALTVLLSRLRDRHAVLLAALVASARLSELPEGDRMLVPGPKDLADVADIGQLRLDITRPQGRIGLPADATKEGNNRKADPAAPGRARLWSSPCRQACCRSGRNAERIPYPVATQPR
jgi:hypothetical protein